MEFEEEIKLDYYDGWAGLAEEIKKHSRSIDSQCAYCENEEGTQCCRIFGEKPHKFASVLSNIPCPQIKVSLESRIKGALYGFAIGDAMGATTEFMSQAEIKKEYGVVKDIIGGGWLNLNKGEVTDDTQMTICVCKALEDTIDIENCERQNISFFENCCKYFVEWFDTNPADIGNCCRNVISNCRNYNFKEWIHFANNPNSLGNGSLMRSMPLVLAKQTIETALVQGRLTHNLGQCLAGELDKISLDLKLKNPTGHVKNTLDNAMYWLFETESFEEAIIGAVNHGGDADTIAAITGSLAGAYYGFYAIPTRWKYDLNTEITKVLDHYTQFFLKIHES